MWARVDQRRGTDVVWCGVPSMWRGSKVIGRSFIMVVRGMPGKGQLAMGQLAMGQLAMGQMAMGQMANGLAAAARGRINPTDGGKARLSHP